ncbi:MAG: V4R domain-containing protein [Fimbriiglobus sp.]
MNDTLELNDTIRGGNYFAEGFYTQTDTRRGVITNRAGARLCCLTTDFLSGFRRAVLKSRGEQANQVFQSCGTKWGFFMAQRLNDEMIQYRGQPMSEFTLADFQATLADYFSHHGWGFVELDFTLHNHGIIVLKMDQPIFAALVPPDEFPTTPVDSLMAGIFAGFFSTLFEQDLACLQTRCKALGSPESLFVLALSERLIDGPSWVAEGKPHEEILVELKRICC